MESPSANLRNELYDSAQNIEKNVLSFIDNCVKATNDGDPMTRILMLEMSQAILPLTISLKRVMNLVKILKALPSDLSPPSDEETSEEENPTEMQEVD